jgi:Kef-type K+ transport system membrane component KefB
LILFATVIIFVLVSLVIGANTSEAVFVGACVSLSSTAVVVKCVKSDELEHMYGLLVMQDVLLGIMLVSIECPIFFLICLTPMKANNTIRKQAMIPALSKSGMEIVFAIAKMTLYIVIFGCISVAIARLLPLAVRLVHRTLGKKAAQHNHELLLLGTIAICFVMMILSDRLDLGLELGCFTAGVIVRSRKQWFEACLSIIEPIRDVFGCLFFASIGLHVYPSFLLSEAMVLLTLTAAVIGFKYVITSIVLVLFRIDLQKSSMMAIGLAQISEFSFVLASRAKQMNIISREVYYLLLAVSAMTLMTTPILWNLIAGRSPSSSSSGGPLSSLPLASAGGPNGLKWNSHERSNHTRSSSSSHYSFARIPRLRDDAHHDMVTLPLHEDAEKAA